MHKLISTFIDRYGDWQTALIQHLQISLITLLIALVIAVPLGIWLQHRPRLRQVALEVAGIFQTIPSLALLGLLIPLVGIGLAPTLIALVIYAILPILANTITGLDQIDPVLEEAGHAFGMTRWQRLTTFELPLALPVIMTGVRTAAVMIVGTATLAALIGAGGLGTFILLGIDRNNASLILIGAISAAMLALLINALLKWAEHAKVKSLGILLAVIVAGLGLSYGPQIKHAVAPQPTITIAGKMGSEPEILINMYQLLLEHDTKLKVQIKPNFGKTTFLYQALRRGDIDIYPEFTGTVVETFLHQPASGKSEAETYQIARRGLANKGLAYLRPMQYENTYALAVKKSFAKQHHLTTITDLARLQTPVTAGFTAEFNDRDDGNRGLQQRYGLNLPVQTMDPALRYQAIAQGKVQVVDAYSTDAELTRYHLVTLQDDQHLFPPYQGAPLMRRATLKQHPEIAKSLNKLAGKISAAEMSRMNYEVSVQGKSAHQVAKTYLTQHGLLK